LPSFGDALEYLRTARVASDSLLLLSGVRAGEMAVIERSPTRAAVRAPEHERLIVTNDYRALSASAGRGNGVFGATTCSRYDRVAALLRHRLPETPSECLTILQDAEVRMPITVQHMALSARTGELVVVPGMQDGD
jgi:hypothetical protein